MEVWACPLKAQARLILNAMTMKTVPAELHTNLQNQAPISSTSSLLINMFQVVYSYFIQTFRFYLYDFRKVLLSNYFLVGQKVNYIGCNFNDILGFGDLCVTNDEVWFGHLQAVHTRLRLVVSRQSVSQRESWDTVTLLMSPMSAANVNLALRFLVCSCWNSAIQKEACFVSRLHLMLLLSFSAKCLSYLLIYYFGVKLDLKYISRGVNILVF